MVQYNPELFFPILKDISAIGTIIIYSLEKEMWLLPKEWDVVIGEGFTVSFAKILTSQTKERVS